MPTCKKPVAGRTPDEVRKRKGPASCPAGPFTNYSWQRPTAPPPYGGSTIGAGGLNGRVRNGNGCDPSAITARKSVRGAR